MKEYTYYTTVTKMVPPLFRKYHYVARAVVLEKTNEGQRPINHDFGETNGRTKDEAERNMVERVVSWIKENDPKAKYIRIL